MRVWFNRTFATHAHTITLLRANPDGEQVWVLGSHADPDSPVLGACDHTIAEPDLVGMEYLTWALEVCRAYAVDVFFPRLHMELVAQHRDLFAADGVAVVVGPYVPMALLADKGAAYADAAAAGLHVPPHLVVDSPEGLADAFADMVAVDGTVCVKPVSGVGAAGFQVLSQHAPSWAQLSGMKARTVPVAGYVDAMQRARDAGVVLPQLLVMPWLPGPEVSVDCLGGVDGALLAGVPRAQHGRRYVLGDGEALEVARVIVARHNLFSLSNTQVRYWRNPGSDDRPLPYLLETNTRMAGGLFQSALAGVNLAWAGAVQALGRDVGDLTPSLGGQYAKVSGTCELAPRGALQPA